MESTALHPNGKWQGGPPLCSRYLLVRFANVATHCLGASPESRSSLTWALGAQSDGSCEVLGVWPHSAEGALDWRAVFSDLTHRGVEHIRYAVHADALAARATFPTIAALAWSLLEPGHFGTSAMGDVATGTQARGAGLEHCSDASDLPRRVRQVLRRSEEAAKTLWRGLRRAAIQHGPFARGNAAAAFVTTWLENAERRERKRRLASQHRAAVAAAALRQ